MLRHKIAIFALLAGLFAVPALADPVSQEESAALMDEGVRGHTILRAYGAVVPEGWGDAGSDGPGWGVGMSLGYGLSRTILLTGGFARHQVDGFSRRQYDVVQLALGVEITSPTRKFIRPWMSVGGGIYRIDLSGDPIVLFQPASFAGGAGDAAGRNRIGLNWGGGLSFRLGERLALEPGARYHYTLGGPDNAAWTTSEQVRLLSMQLGLSYVLR